MLFWGALTVAIGVESCGLHEKLALKIIMIFGTDPKWRVTHIFLTITCYQT
jgi:di/tricarboxylate transporter